jgi:hypothetical protein
MEAKMKYSEKLKDPRWQKKRLEIFERDKWTCQFCGDTESTLVVHHLEYIPGREPWEYDNSYLLTLCEGCHETDREERPTAEKALLITLKLRGYQAHHIKRLVNGFYYLKTDKSPEVISSIIERFFQNEDLMGLVEYVYSELLKIESETKGRENGETKG